MSNGSSDLLSFCGITNALCAILKVTKHTLCIFVLKESSHSILSNPAKEIVRFNKFTLQQRRTAYIKSTTFEDV